MMEKERVWSTRKKNATILMVAMAFYWALFVLFLFPSELFPAMSYRVSTLRYSIILASVFISCSIIFSLSARNAVTFIVRHRLILAALWLLTVSNVALPLLFQASGLEVPVYLFWSYPVIVALYGFVLSLHLASRFEDFDERETAVILTTSLLISFLFGLALASSIEKAGLIQSDSNYLMLIASGLVILFTPPSGSTCSVLGNAPTESHKFGLRRAASAKLLLPVILFCYLIGSGVFMGVYAPSNDGPWFLDDNLHCMLGLLLFLVFALYSFIGWRTSRRPYPWVVFVFICLAVLYCAALLYPAWTELCKEIMLPSRPLAMVLLWASASAWARATNRPVPWAIAVIALPMISTADLIADAVCFLSFPQETLDFAVKCIVLLTAFAMTVGLALWIFAHQRPDGDQQGLGVRNRRQSGLQSGVTLEYMTEAYGLSRREFEVLILLSAGNTQKKIAQNLTVSINSVQTYAKNLYRKLDIHSKQELIDLVDRIEQTL